jgi:glycosyltransferase involved in cell wall biosynthesis
MCVYCKNIYQNIDNFTKVNESETELISGNLNDIQNPFLSIIITVYKRQKYIHDAIKSAINQKNAGFDYEILVFYDDPDVELTELKDYRHSTNIFFYRNCRNLGLYNNMNLAAKNARGRYITFLHDDDILYPEYLSETGKFILHTKQDAKCILVNRDVTGLITGQEAANKKKIKYIKNILFFPLYLVRKIFRKEYKKITLREGLTYLLSNVYKAPSCGTLFEKECFIKSGGFNQDFWPVSDYYFFVKFNQHYPVYMLRKKLACYRWLDNLSQDKSIQYSGFEHLVDFFQSKQPIKSINKYYKYFYTEILYAKFLMINKEYRNEIKDKYFKFKRCNGIKWRFFKVYNITFRFFHDLV